MKSISPMVSFVITIFITSMTVIFVYTGIKNVIEKNVATSLINEASVNLDLLSSTIKDVGSGYSGSKRTISLSVSDGYYFLDREKNTLIYSYDSPQKIDLLGRIGDKFLSLGTIFYTFFSTQEIKNFKTISGNWKVENNRLEGINGTIYLPINGSFTNLFISSKFSSDNNLGELFLDPSPENLILYLTLDEGIG
ncbi:MAG: hypothetical protein N3D78_00005, partial [Candidatus Aenigmarchaeota archaeon]|nr:hypothetical protein [Candidatus Aenigmarchaeota archaeon]